MTNSSTDPIANARVLVATARGLARDTARRRPDSTWIDAYTAVDRAEAQLGIVASATFTDPQCPAPARQRTEMDCLGLLEDAEKALAGIRPGDGPTGLVLARAYLTEAITEVSGRQP